jgi:branched-chain amino acid transport system permease protein
MTKFAQLLVSGAALGAVYALVCLGFVVIYRATGVINFAQAGFVVLGAFLTYNATATWGLSFGFGLILAALIGGFIGIAVERVVLRPMSGQPLYAILLVTVGVLLLVEPIVTTIWRDPPANLETPFALHPLDKDWGVQILQINVVTIILAAVVLTAFFMFFKYTKYGVAMRATAVDQEAALMQGINTNRIIALSWGIAGVVAVLGGTMLASGAGPAPSLQFAGIAIIALKALPAMVLGGLDSPQGAIVGGMIVGIAELLTSGYQTDFVEGSVGGFLHAQDWLEPGFVQVMPWLIMLVVLLVRPYGLFGTKQVERL